MDFVMQMSEKTETCFNIDVTPCLLVRNCNRQYNDYNGQYNHVAIEDNVHTSNGSLFMSNWLTWSINIQSIRKQVNRELGTGGTVGQVGSFVDVLGSL